MSDNNAKSDTRTLQQRVMGVSVAVSVVMLAGKLGAYWISGSTAILSDAAESVIHGVATGFAFYSLWLSWQPANRQYLYGRGKIAYFSAGFEGALILCAGLAIIVLGVRDLILGPELKRLDLGIAITAALCLVNLVLGLTLVQIGKQRNALILVANGKHVLTDMWTSLGVVVGVAVVWKTGLLWLDPVVAIVVGLNIGWTAFSLLNKSARGLLDAADSTSVQAVIAAFDAAKRLGTIEGYHQVRLRNSDDKIWVEAHLLMPSELSVLEAHERANAVEAGVRAKLEGHQVHITTHVEPYPHKEAHAQGHDGLNDPISG